MRFARWLSLCWLCDSSLFRFVTDPPPHPPPTRSRSTLMRVRATSLRSAQVDRSGCPPSAARRNRRGAQESVQEQRRAQALETRLAGMTIGGIAMFVAGRVVWRKGRKTLNPALGSSKELLRTKLPPQFEETDRARNITRDRRAGAARSARGGFRPSSATEGSDSALAAEPRWKTATMRSTSTRQPRVQNEGSPRLSGHYPFEPPYSTR